MAEIDDDGPARREAALPQRQLLDLVGDDRRLAAAVLVELLAMSSSICARHQDAFGMGDRLWSLVKQRLIERALGLPDLLDLLDAIFPARRGCRCG